MHPATAIPLSAIAGEYTHEVYGKMTIMLESGKLIARFEHHKGRQTMVEALGSNRFQATFNDPYRVSTFGPLPLTMAK